MNITGNFFIQRMSWSGGSLSNLHGCGGAFYAGADGGYYGDTSEQVNRDYNCSQAIFDASRTWTGSTSSVGGSGAHNNMPPYIVKYCWERTA